VSIDIGRVRTLKSVLADLEGVKDAALGGSAHASGEASK
jgi:hypothetical protein